MEIYRELDDLYSRLGVLKNTLHSDCRFSNLCWNGVDEKRKSYGEIAQLYRPYIGARYTESRILALGINMNEYGGYNAEIELADMASNDIKNGKKKTFAKDGYKGSLVWHRILSYATFILREISLFEIPELRPYPEKEELSKAIDFIAVTNSIKCCPWEERSKPTNEMWKHCPNFILKEEMGVLKPKHIIVLGVDNFSSLLSLFFNKVELVDGNTRIIKARFDDCDINIYSFPHPSSSQGTSMSRMDELERLLMNSNFRT